MAIRRLVELEKMIIHSKFDTHIRGNTCSAFGSTNNKIPRWTNVVIDRGEHITFRQSATLGDDFFINTPGLYFFGVCLTTDGVSGIGISLNSSELTTGVLSIAVADLMVSEVVSGANQQGAMFCVMRLEPGDIVRPHHDSGILGTAARCQFTAGSIGMKSLAGKV